MNNLKEVLPWRKGICEEGSLNNLKVPTEVVKACCMRIMHHQTGASLVEHDALSNPPNHSIIYN